MMLVILIMITKIIIMLFTTLRISLLTIMTIVMLKMIQGKERAGLGKKTKSKCVQSHHENASYMFQRKKSL